MVDDPKDNKTPDNASSDIKVDKEEIVDNITKEVTAKVVAEAGPRVSEQAKKELIDKLVGKEEKVWVPKSYEEIKEVSKKEAKEEILATLEQKEKAKAEEAKKIQDQQAKTVEEQNKFWDKQLNTMVGDKRLPAIKEEIVKKLTSKEPLNDEERQDPGIRARAEIYRLAAEHKEPNLELVYYKYYKPGQSSTPAGARAPVFGSSKAVSPSGQADFTYEEVHNTTLEQIAEEG